MLARTEEEIHEQSNLAEDHITEGIAQWPNMTYEEGVSAALRWVMGESDSKPMEDD